MIVRVDAEVWFDEDVVPVVLECERSDEDELALQVRWPDYVRRPPAITLWLSDINGAAIAAALAALIGERRPERP